MQFITLDTVDDPRVEAYVSLTEMQLRNRLEPAKGVFIAESPKVIDRALAADREPLSLLVEEPWLEGMKDTFDFIDGRWGADIPVYVASPEQLKRLTGYRLHRGALCAMRRWPLPSVAEIDRGRLRPSLRHRRRPPRHRTQGPPQPYRLRCPPASGFNQPKRDRR